MNKQKFLDNLAIGNHYINRYGEEFEILNIDKSKVHINFIETNYKIRAYKKTVINGGARDQINKYQLLLDGLKTCRFCGNTVKIKDFQKIGNFCLKCKSAYDRLKNKRLRAKNMDKINKQRALYRKRNKEEIAMKNAKYILDNKKKIKEAQKKYIIENREFVNLRKNAYCNPKKYKAEYEKERKKRVTKHRQKKIAENNRVLLTDNYIKSQLSTKFEIPFSDIPADLIELQRALITVQRQKNWRE